MPIDPNSIPITVFPLQINVPVEDGVGVFIAMQIQSDGTASPESMDAIQQSLVDHLQEWPGRRHDLDVTGQKYDTNLFTVRPTHPIVPVDNPPPDGD